MFLNVSAKVRAEGSQGRYALRYFRNLRADTMEALDVIRAIRAVGFETEHLESAVPTETQAFVEKAKGWGFRAFVAEQGDYGFVTDADGSRVMGFSFSGFSTRLSGHYGPPSTESGTGWSLEQSPDALHSAEDMRKALYANPPSWCGKGWRSLSTLVDHLGRYHFEEV